MIAFSCTRCGMKLQVKPDFAGRSSRCPTCKQVLTVPLPGSTTGFVPPQLIEGEESSLAKLGLHGGVTLGRPEAQRLPSSGRNAGKDRYLIEGEIARGGMGAVLRAVDCDMRREVAVKYMLDAKDPKKQSRFIEEAQINGQLEHPNIVPVYNLGVDAQKRPFIMMKMVKGKSLGQVLDALRETPRTSEKEWPLSRLLTIFVNVCNALAYAHARGVIHRDLKPANIMVGDFGETYVMDWGVAKVMANDGSPMIQAAAAPAPVAAVRTSREAGGHMTQDGAVVGTPAYMSPEQATGHHDSLDQRSDVYALGAILYELLTLQPPIDREGGSMSMLLRVAEGAIIPPEVRDPKRTRAGKVPRELAAIALKAMAKRREERYSNVEELRRDIERFQEGRSVSAKEDTAREMIWKFVKRNKGATTAAVLILTVVLWSSWQNFLARRDVEKAYADYQQEQKEKQEAYAEYLKEQKEKLARTEKAVPALIESARLAVERHRRENAMTQVNLALDYDPESAEARMLKGQLLILEKDFSGARRELEKYLKKHPDASVERLRELCGRPKPDDVSNLLLLADVFIRQNLPALADDLLTRYGRDSFEARNRLLELYRNRIDAAWKGLGNRLTLDNDGVYKLDFGDQVQVVSLIPLEGMPLTALNLARCTGLRDLSPLKGMPLTTLILSNCAEVRELAPLKNMPLRILFLNLTNVSDLSPLKGMPLTFLSLEGCPAVHDLTPLEGMSLTQIRLPIRALKGLEELRRMSTLKLIEDLPAAEFWKRHDAKK